MKTLLLAAFSFLFIVGAQAQAGTATANANQNVTLILQDAMSVTLTGGVTMTFTNAADYDAGKTDANSTLTVKSNMAYNVTVKAAAADFTYTGSATNPPLMPASVLTVTASNPSSGTTPPLTLTAADQALFGTAQTRTSSRIHGISYKANPGYDYATGSYQLNVIYTATQQ